MVKAQFSPKIRKELAYMDLQELFLRRQSCRDFTQEAVSTDDVLYCLEAARLAPSACNAQPYHLIVCRGDTARAVAAATQGMGMNSFTKNVPCFVVVAEDDYNRTAAVGSRLKGQDYRSVDIGLAVSQLCLMAEERGLGSCILGWFDEAKLQNLLHTQRRIRLVVALGHAAEGYPIRKKQRKPLSELVEFR